MKPRSRRVIVKKADIDMKSKKPVIRKNQRSFTMYIPDFLYDEIKYMCAQQGVTFKNYILKSVIARINLEKENNIEIKETKCLHI